VRRTFVELGYLVCPPPVSSLGLFRLYSNYLVLIPRCQPQELTMTLTEWKLGSRYDGHVTSLTREWFADMTFSHITHPRIPDM
jgi:hypothetical protein